MKKFWLVLVLMAVMTGSLKADPNNQASISKLQVKAQECYPDSRYVVVDGALVPKPKVQPPQQVPVYVPEYAPVYVAPPPQVYLGFGYTYWGGHNGGHGGSHHGGGGHGGGGHR
jgi:hypothetical protein